MQLKRTQILAVLVVVIPLGLLLWQHWGMMLSNSDDPWIIRETWAQTLHTASVQGRFWLIPINMMAKLPYLLGNWEAANLVKIGVNGLVFGMFVLFCARLTNPLVGLLTGLVWLALIDVSPGYYSPFHGFLMMFNLEFAALFASFAIYLRRLDKPADHGAIVAPYLLFGFSTLAYEPMLFYSGVFPALFLYRHLERRTDQRARLEWFGLAKVFAQRNYPLALVILAYIGTYFAYRHFQPTGGRGIDFNFPVLDIIKTVYRFSVNGFHVQFKPLDNYFPASSSLLNLVFALVYACSIALGVLVIVPKIQGELYPARLFNKTAVVVILFFVFCPNLLLGLVQTYRQWAAEDPHYVGNYFSSFPLAIVVMLVVLNLVGGRRAVKEKVLFVFVMYLLASSACDNYVRWSNMAQANRRDSQLWVQAIEQLKQKTYAAAGPHLICASNSPEHVSGDDRYWSLYLSDVLGAPITFNSKVLDLSPCQQVVDFNTLRFPKKHP